jgi:hypothetical protein
MKKIVIISGLIAGAIVSTIMATSMALMTNCGGDGSMLIGYASMLLAFSMIFVAIKNYRDKQNGGVISFSKALTIGILIALIASSFYVATWAIEYKYFMPDFMDKYAAHAIDKIKASGASPASMDKQIAQITSMKTNYNNPLFFTVITFAEIFPVGLIVSLICALILKRKDKGQMRSATA